MHKISQLKKTNSILIFFLSSFLFLSCFTKQNRQLGIRSNDEFCSKIDTLVMARYTWKAGGLYANEIIPVLVENSGIEASGDKGTFGYIYRSDSLFDSDIMKWRQYYKCLVQ